LKKAPLKMKARPKPSPTTAAMLRASLRAASVEEIDAEQYRHIS
jgi:hypothetical protein